MQILNIVIINVSVDRAQAGLVEWWRQVSGVIWDRRIAGRDLF